MTNIKKARVAGMESKRGNVGEREIKRPGNEGAFGWWKGSEILKKLFYCRILLYALYALIT